MPMTYTLDFDANLIRILGRGRLTDEEMIGCVASLVEDPRLTPDMNTLSDMREIEMGFTSQGIMQMIGVMEGAAGRRPGARAAIVTSSDVAFGMARIVEVRSEDRVDPRFRIFRDMAEARAWLGIGES